MKKRCAINLLCVVQNGAYLFAESDYI